ncbi:MHYT domain-containing protein [Deinococcus peraridilitoris]|uniref:Bacterial signaling protein N terminal repeat protein n=1 Tax=Deinococcus peraridilitoris (strain DSM 19664 / LMG 22246 / CIP 109416 / KR-200) TaxID=937777 RepID=L0A6Z2_DEIPD|nr:MHYT domain-containing protein [Deinococcus peraridilitoris]AFZ69586.1 Bacterial signaling protein N terminal repeat protein [Deinococcus peraridilitoris DSM 19664]
MHPVTGQDDPQLVLLSILIACLASCATLSVAARVQPNLLRLLVPHLLFSPIVMAVGIWSMHFTGMLALKLPTPVAYDPLTVVLSALAGMIGAVLALRPVVPLAPWIFDPSAPGWRLPVTTGEAAPRVPSCSGAGRSLQHDAQRSFQFIMTAWTRFAEPSSSP